MVLLPDLGTTVIDGPPVSASPRLPEIVKVSRPCSAYRGCSPRRPRHRGCARVDAVDGQTAVFGVSPVGCEQQHRRPQLHLSVTCDNAGHELEHVVVRPRRGNLLKYVAVDDLRTACALHVDDGRFAEDRDGLFECADAEVNVDGAVRLPDSSTPSRLTVLNPCRLTVTV